MVYETHEKFVRAQEAARGYNAKSSLDFECMMLNFTVVDNYYERNCQIGRITLKVKL